MELKTIALGLGLGAFMLMGCGGTGGAVVEHVTKVESVGGFSVPESVIGGGNTFYVSNVNSRESHNAWQDNDGFISRVTKAGLGEGSSTIKSIKWATGLQAPKGMALTDEYLFVCDLDRVAAISIADGSIFHIYSAPAGITHLNDIVLDEENKIAYVTDSMTDQIWKVTEAGDWSLFYDTEPMPAHSNQNGLYLDGNKIIMQGEKGKLKSINTATKEVKVIASNLCGDERFKIDGITKVDNKYLVSTWPAKICIVPENGEPTEVLHTIEEGPAAADIFASEGLDALLVPDFDSEIDIYTKDK